MEIHRKHYFVLTAFLSVFLFALPAQAMSLTDFAKLPYKDQLSYYEKAVYQLLDDAFKVNEPTGKAAGRFFTGPPKTDLIGTLPRGLEVFFGKVNAALESSKDTPGLLDKIEIESLLASMYKESVLPNVDMSAPAPDPGDSDPKKQLLHGDELKNYYKTLINSGVTIANNDAGLRRWLSRVQTFEASVTSHEIVLSNKHHLTLEPNGQFYDIEDNRDLSPDSDSKLIAEATQKKQPDTTTTADLDKLHTETMKLSDVIDNEKRVRANLWSSTK